MTMSITKNAYPHNTINRTILYTSVPRLHSSRALRAEKVGGRVVRELFWASSRRSCEGDGGREGSVGREGRRER